VCKRGGRILLLQHGKGTWDFINTVLDKGAGEQGGGLVADLREAWGCAAAALQLSKLRSCPQQLCCGSMP